MTLQQNTPMVVIIDALDECKSVSFEALAHILHGGGPTITTLSQVSVTSSLTS